MAFGLGRLRLSPDDFWAMTPKELAAAMAPHLPDHGAAPERTELERLMALHPDEQAGRRPHGRGSHGGDQGRHWPVR